MNDHHDTYVAKGYCPAVRWSKAWCARRDQHHGPHMSIRLLVSGRLSQEFWDAGEERESGGS